MKFDPERIFNYAGFGVKVLFLVPLSLILWCFILPFAAFGWLIKRIFKGRLGDYE